AVFTAAYHRKPHLEPVPDLTNLLAELGEPSRCLRGGAFFVVSGCESSWSFPSPLSAPLSSVRAFRRLTHSEVTRCCPSGPSVPGRPTIELPREGSPCAVKILTRSATRFLEAHSTICSITTQDGPSHPARP